MTDTGKTDWAYDEAERIKGLGWVDLDSEIIAASLRAARKEGKVEGYRDSAEVADRWAKKNATHYVANVSDILLSNIRYRADDLERSA